MTGSRWQSLHRDVDNRDRRSFLPSFLMSTRLMIFCAVALITILVHGMLLLASAQARADGSMTLPGGAWGLSAGAVRGNEVHRRDTCAAYVYPRGQLDHPAAAAHAINAALTKEAKRILIATSGISGMINSGGIGTFCSALAQLLAERNVNVTMLYLGGTSMEMGTIDDWVDYHKKRKITLIPLPLLSDVPVESSRHRFIAYMTLQWLLKHDGEFDAIYFHDWRGYSYYAQVARNLGIAFATTPMIIGMHGPTAWSTLNSYVLFDQIEQLEIDFMERTAVQLADAVIAPSKYIVEWCRENAWQLPRSVFVHPNILLRDDEGIAATAELTKKVSGKKTKIRTVVFFGRLEIRKGLDTFCTAVTSLGESNPAIGSKMRVVFLGKEVQNAHGRASSRQFITRCMKGSDIPWVIASDLSSTQATAYLRSQHALAVMVSVSENSPYTVIECLEHGIPFISSNTGGIPELIIEEDREHVLVLPNPVHLAKAIERAFIEGALVARPVFSQTEVRNTWIPLLSSITAAAPRTPSFRDERCSLPLVTVCIIGRNRGQLLKQTLESVKMQDYLNIQTIVVDDFSDDPDTLEYLTWLENNIADFGVGSKVIRHDRVRGDGASRNTAVHNGDGEFVTFIDDDNCGKPYMVSSFVKAITNSDMDILTCFLDEFTDLTMPMFSTKLTSRWVPLGPSIAGGMFRNMFGDTSMIVRRQVFLAIGGFTEELGMGYTDWEFLAKANLKGYKLSVIPVGLVWYRKAAIPRITGSTSHTKNGLRTLRPYMSAFPQLKEIFIFARGLALKCDPFSTLSSADASSQRDYGPAQGVNGFFYGYFLMRDIGSTDLRFYEMTLYDTRGRWRLDDPTLPEHLNHHRTGAHPMVTGGRAYWPVKRWISKHEGPVHVSFLFTRLTYNCQRGDGIIGRVYLDGREIWFQRLDAQSCSSTETVIKPSVRMGSILDFAIDPVKDDYFDGTELAVSMMYL